jgi:hypothetical protein
MINEFYDALVKRIAEHGVRVHGSRPCNTPVDKDHAVISLMYGAQKCFVFLGNKSFLIRMYDDNNSNQTRMSV